MRAPLVLVLLALPTLAWAQRPPARAAAPLVSVYAPPALVVTQPKTQHAFGKTNTPQPDGPDAAPQSVGPATQGGLDAPGEMGGTTQDRLKAEADRRAAALAALAAAEKKAADTQQAIVDNMK